MSLIKMLFANNASTTLAADFAIGATELHLASGTGALFPNPVTVEGEYFAMTLVDALTGTRNEIVYCTARTGDICTVVRGEEGTSDQAWITGDVAANLWTAGSAQAVQQTVQDLRDDLLNTADPLKNTSLIGKKRALTGAKAELLTDYFDLAEFRFRADAGAIGDGSSDDATLIANHAAAQRISQWVMDAGGGKIIIEYGDYKFGKQDFAGATGLNYAYKMRQMFSIHGCTKPVIIEIQGATFSLVDGIKFGSYNPVSGAPYFPSLPFTNRDYIADAGYFIQAYGNKAVSITGSGDILGNADNAVLGGYWGDTGYQIAGYGIELTGNERHFVSGLINIQNTCLDGILSNPIHGYQDHQTIIVGVTSEYNCRQGISVTGGQGTFLQSCKLNYTGQGAFYSSPGSGCDIESEQPGGEDPEKGIKRFIANLCEFVGNLNTGMVADSGSSSDILFNMCRFLAVDGYAIWPNKPNMRFLYCNIFGGVVNTYAGTLFSHCNWSDSVSLEESPPAQSVDVYGSVWEDCTFYLSRLNHLSFRDGCILRRCKFYIRDGSQMTNQDYVINFGNSTIEDIEIYDQMTSPPADGVYVITTDMTAIGQNFIDSPSGKVKWTSWSVGAAGFTGYYGVTNPENEAPYVQVTCKQVLADGIKYNAYNGLQYTWQVDSIPTGGMRPDGTNQIGDRFEHWDATVGQPKAWRCTVAGNPGTIVSEGNL